MATALILLLASNIAKSYPDHIRHGYPTCSTCHADSGGGGPLTAYGRAISGEFNTWSAPEDSLHENLILGADVRYLYSRAQGPQTTRQFLMQAEVSLGFDTEHISAITTVGDYNGKAEMREAYLELRRCDQDIMTLRGGKFMPQYGLKLPDHTQFIRRNIGFDQGREVYGGDLTYTTQWFEVIMSTPQSNVQEALLGLLSLWVIVTSLASRV